MAKVILRLSNQRWSLKGVPDVSPVLFRANLILTYSRCSSNGIRAFERGNHFLWSGFEGRRYGTWNLSFSFSVLDLNSWFRCCRVRIYEADATFAIFLSLIVSRINLVSTSSLSHNYLNCSQTLTQSCPPKS
jgi:hypothetical protein